MKRFLSAVGIVLLTGLCLNVAAASLTTNSGKVFQNAEIKKISAGRVTITHDGGTEILELADLPDNFIAALSIGQRNALQSRVTLTLKDGRILKETSIVEFGGGKVTLACDRGVVEVPLDQLPEHYLKTFTRRQLEAVKQPKRTSAKELHGDAAPGNIPPAAPSGTSTGDKVVGRDAEGHEIFEGPRGGRYYIGDSGRKIYLRKKK